MAAGALASGCGGDGEDVMRATLTDEGCAYEGDTTPAPGLFTVEVRNETLRFANFSLWELAEGAKLGEFAELYEQALQPPQLKRPISAARVEPEATSELPANESTGRYVVLCEVLPKTDARRTSESPVFPSRAYAAVELSVRPTS
jgi:hypothetical protein